MPLRYRLTPRQRLKRGADFRRVYDHKRSVRDRWLIVYGYPNGLAHLRLGLSVSRKVGGAVQRNRFRRLYKEAYRLDQHALPIGMDIVLIPGMSEAPTLEQLRSSLARLLPQLRRKVIV